MKITLIQDIIHWADVDANIQKVEQQLSQLAGTTDLVVLPEMFATGFCTDQLSLAEEINGKTVQKLREWSVKYQLAITGSFIAKENDKIYNRAFFAFPNGEIQFADKRHLFSMGGENKRFSQGNKKLIVEFFGFRIFVLVCYDIRFPVWARNVDNDYDLLIFVANFPERRISDWDVLLKARAIENQSYVCGVNRVGEDGVGIEYNGHSILLDYKGNVLLDFPEHQQSIQTCEIKLEPMELFRERFPVWKDADSFEIKKDA